MSAPIQVSPETIMAIRLLKARDDDATITVEDISKSLLQVIDLGFDLGDVALRRVPGGVYSEGVGQFVARLHAAGYASSYEPIRLCEDGFRICGRILDDEHRKNAEAVLALGSVLSFDVIGAILSHLRKVKP